MDQTAPLALLQAGFSFGDLLIQAGAVAVAGLWACVPFSVFGVRRRLDTITEAQRDHAEALTQELRRFRDLASALPPPRPRTVRDSVSEAARRPSAA